MTAAFQPIFGIWTARPMTAQSAASEGPTFEVASIKPDKIGSRMVTVNPPRGGRFQATDIRLKALIRMAYHVADFQISGAPGRAGSERFDVEAKSEGNPGLTQRESIAGASAGSEWPNTLYGPTGATATIAGTPERAGRNFGYRACRAAFDERREQQSESH